MKLNLTDKILDLLGFSEYWDEHGTWGGRTLTFSNGDRVRIIEQEEMDDDTEGHWQDGTYIAHHFYFVGWFAIPKTDAPHYDLFFIHELYDVIKNHYPNSLKEFVDKCESLKMGKYINYYIADEYPQSASTVEVCPSCSSNNIRWNKNEIEIGDKTGSVADVQYKFCEDCGHRFQIDWFD